MILVGASIPLPTWLARLCLQAVLQKGLGHKYVRRVPTGDPKKPWRYFYNLTGKTGRFDPEQIKEGAKFRVAGGHLHVTAIKDGQAELVHDETGEKVRMRTEHLADLLEAHHGEEIERHAAREENKQKVIKDRRVNLVRSRAQRLPRGNLAIANAVADAIGHDFGGVDFKDQRVQDELAAYLPKLTLSKLAKDDSPFAGAVAALIARAGRRRTIRTWADLIEAKVGGSEDTVFDVLRQIGHEIDDEKLKRAAPPQAAIDELARQAEEEHHRTSEPEDVDEHAEEGDTSFDVASFAASITVREISDIRKSLTRAKWAEIPAWMGVALLQPLAKAMGHKYLRRVPTGNPKRPWRYFYRVTGGEGLGHESELVEGAAFRVNDAGKEGHFHVLKADGDQLTIKHDESGLETIVSKEGLRALLHREHAAAIEGARTQARQNVNDAMKYGSEKQRIRTYTAFKKVEAAFGPQQKEAETKLPDKLTKTKIRIATKDPEGAEIEAEQLGNFALHRGEERGKKKSWYEVTYVPSGMRVGSGFLGKKADAVAIVEHLDQAIGRESAAKLGDVPMDEYKRIVGAVQEFWAAREVTAKAKPVEPEVRPAASTPIKPMVPVLPKEPTALEQPKAEAPAVKSVDGASEKLERVGDHIWGSRKDLAKLGTITSSKDLENMSYDDAAAIVTKNRLLTPLDLQSAKGLGMSPGVAYLSMALLGAIKAKAGDSTAERSTYVDEVRQIEGGLTSVKTLEQFTLLLNDLYRAHSSSSQWASIASVQNAEEAKERIAQLQKDNPGAQYRYGYDYSNYTLRIAQKVAKPFDALGPRFVSFIKRKGDLFRNTYMKALDLDGGWSRVGEEIKEKSGMTPEQAWAWLEASTKAEKDGAAKEKPKRGQGSDRGQTERGWSGAKDVAGEVQRIGGKKVDRANPTRTKETFNFREIDYGQYLSQADREYHTKALEESMHDFADVLGVDPSLMSFQGRLGVALGARGSGKAKAHYEPVRKVINITKVRGGGSLAHEWGHALDNILATHWIKTSTGSAQGDAFLSKTPEHSSLPPEVSAAVETVMNAILKHPDPERARREHKEQLKKLLQVRDELTAKNNELVREHEKLSKKSKDTKQTEIRIKNAEARIADYSRELAEIVPKLAEDRKKGKRIAADLDARPGHLQYWLEKETKNLADLKSGEGVQSAADRTRMAEIVTEIESARPAINRAIKEHNEFKSMNPTISAYAKSGAILGAAYWGSKHELWARAFESFVQDKLASAGRRNTYLVDGTTKKYPTQKLPGSEESIQPYPQGDERKRINEAFEKFIDVIRGAGHLEKALREMMPTNLVHNARDEEKWKRAKAAARKSNPDNFYALAVSIYENMEKGGEGSRGGKIIGHTRSGKPVYDAAHTMTLSHEHFRGWTLDDHYDAQAHHHAAADKLQHEANSVRGDSKRSRDRRLKLKGEVDAHRSAALEHAATTPDIISKAIGDDLVKSDALYQTYSSSPPSWITRYSGTPFADRAFAIEEASCEQIVALNERMRTLNLESGFNDPDAAAERCSIQVEQAAVNAEYQAAKEKLSLDFVKWLRNKAKADVVGSEVTKAMKKDDPIEKARDPLEDWLIKGGAIPEAEPRQSLEAHRPEDGDEIGGEGAGVPPPSTGGNSSELPPVAKDDELDTVGEVLPNPGRLEIKTPLTHYTRDLDFAKSLADERNARRSADADTRSHMTEQRQARTGYGDFVKAYHFGPNR